MAAGGQFDAGYFAGDPDVRELALQRGADGDVHPADGVDAAGGGEVEGELIRYLILPWRHVHSAAADAEKGRRRTGRYSSTIRVRMTKDEIIAVLADGRVIDGHRIDWHPSFVRVPDQPCSIPPTRLR